MAYCWNLDQQACIVDKEDGMKGNSYAFTYQILDDLSLCSYMLAS